MRQSCAPRALAAAPTRTKDRTIATRCSFNVIDVSNFPSAPLVALPSVRVEPRQAVVLERLPIVGFLLGVDVEMREGVRCKPCYRGRLVDARATRTRVGFWLDGVAVIVIPAYAEEPIRFGARRDARESRR